MGSLVNPTVVPTLLVRSLREFSSRLSFFSVFSHLQVDVMDGSFVSFRTPDVSSLPSLKGFVAEAHLMVSDPFRYLRLLRRKGFSKVVAHVEVLEDPVLFFREASSLGFVVGLALNPETSLSVIRPFLKVFDYFLVLGVSPGRNAQSMFDFIPYKVSLLRRLTSKPVHVDGGVGLSTVKSLSLAGVDVLNSGSFLFSGLGGFFELLRLHSSFKKSPRPSSFRNFRLFSVRSFYSFPFSSFSFDVSGFSFVEKKFLLSALLSFDGKVFIFDDYRVGEVKSLLESFF